MESLVKQSAKTIEEYRHNIKLLKYHLKREQKINETLRYKQAKKHKNDRISKVSKIQKKHQAYSIVETVSQLNQRTKEMGLALGDIFRMADHQYEGEITKEQFMKTILRLKNNIDEHMLNEMFYAIDTDFNGHLSQDQYSEFLYAHGGCDNKEAITFQKRSGEKLAAVLKKKGIKLSSFLDKTPNPCPAEDILSKLKDLKLNINESMILLKMWDPSMTGQIKHEIYLKSMQNVKQKDEKQIQNEKFQKGIQQLCVILRDRKLNPIVIFQESQADGKTGISEAELEEGLKKLIPEETSFQIRKWVSLINLNNDQQITREEFVSAIKSFYSIQQINKFSEQYDKMHPKLKRALNNEQIPTEKIMQQLSNAIEDSGRTKTQTFHTIDINKNGLIDKEELYEGLKNMGIKIGLIAKVLAVFDRDASGEVSLDEWLSILGEDVEMEEVQVPSKLPKQSKVKDSHIQKGKSNVEDAKKDDSPKKEVKKKPEIKKPVSKPDKKEEKNDKTSVITKKTSPLKDKDKNKTLKSSQQKVKKPITKPQVAKPSKTSYAEDSMIESRKDLDKPVSEHDEQVNFEEVEKQIGEMYAKSKKEVLTSFKNIANNKKDINPKQLMKCIDNLHIKTPYSESQIRALFQGNVSSSGTFQYKEWLKNLPQKYDLTVIKEKEEEENQKKKVKQQKPKKKETIQKEDEEKEQYQEQFEVETNLRDSRAKESIIKRAEDHEAFQGLLNLVVQNQNHPEQGYKFSQFIASQQQVTLLKEKYLPLSQKIKSKKKIYQDPKFPKTIDSLTDVPPSKSNIGEVSMLKWKHYSQVFKSPQLFDKGIEPNDICQGQLGDCYFLCSLASLAEYKKLIERLFEYMDLENGYFLIWLCIDGIWKLIQVDGFIPVKPNGKSLVFSRCREGDQQLWVILLEKAYAKAYGCYQHIVGGEPYQAIKDLSGAPGQSFSHKSDKINENILWQKLYHANAEKFIMTCGTDNSQQGKMKLDEHSESVTVEGLVIGHAYSILDVTVYKGEKLIQLRNPWGNMEWSGPWSDKSNKWTPQAKKALNYNQSSDDGIFWMPYQTYFTRYATTAINYIRPSYFYHSQTKTSIKNLVIKIKASSLKHGFIMVAQQDHRKKGLPSNTPYNVCHLIAINHNNGKIVSKLADEKYMFQREGSVQLNSEGVDENSEFIVIVNLEKSTNINLCTYSNQQFEYELDDGFDVMLEYIEAIASVEQSQNPQRVQTSGDKTFKIWLSSVGEYAFQVFKNITNKSLTMQVQLQKPSNLQLQGKLTSKLEIKPGLTQSIKGKIIDAKKPFSFGPMRQRSF